MKRMNVPGISAHAFLPTTWEENLNLQVSLGNTLRACVQKRKAEEGEDAGDR